jgi:excisionase family DNA binding protein
VKSLPRDAVPATVATRATKRAIATESVINDANGVLTHDELAHYLKVSRRTVEEWQHAEVIPFIRAGRVVLFHWPDVLEHLRRNHCAGAWKRKEVSP